MANKAMGLALLLLASLAFVTEAFPMLQGKRLSQRAWGPYPILYQPRATRPYAPYYDTYIPDSADLLDLYYAQDPYEKFRMYKVPQYYYPEQFYYDEDEEPEEDEVSYGSLPESWYNSPNADANAMFLQNLVMAQMYKDAASKNQRYPPSSPYSYQKYEDYDEDGEPYVFGEPIREIAASAPPKEDKEVRDLKNLVDTGKQRRKTNDGSRMSLEENRWVNKRSEFTTEKPQRSSIKNQNELRGQDEVVMLRPASSVRPNSFHQRSYQPSAYDAIKKLLLQQNEGDRQPQKRSYVLNEESLVEQLGKLKKTS